MREALTARSTARTRVSRLTASLIGTALLVAACGSDDSGDLGDSGTDTAGTGGQLSERDSEHLPDDWDDIVAAANEEGAVIAYTNFTGEQIQPINDAFNEIYPDIEVQMVNDSVATLPTRFSQERSSTGESPADLLLSSLFEALIKENQDWFTNIKEQDEGFLPSLQDMRPVAVPDDRPHSVTMASYTWRLIYNTTKVDETDLPESWEDMTDSQWAGVGVMADPRAAATYMAFYRLLHEELGDDFLTGLKDNEYSLSQAAADVAQKVGSGAFSVGFPVNTSTVAALVESGAPIDTLELLPAELGATTMSFPLDGPNPNAARVYGNFLISAQGQELLCEATTLASLNENAEGACGENSVPEGLSEMRLEISDEEAGTVTGLLGLD